MTGRLCTSHLESQHVFPGFLSTSQFSDRLAENKNANLNRSCVSFRCKPLSFAFQFEALVIRWDFSCDDNVWLISLRSISAPLNCFQCRLIRTKRDFRDFERGCCFRTCWSAGFSRITISGVYRKWSEAVWWCHANMTNICEECFQRVAESLSRRFKAALKTKGCT